MEEKKGIFARFIDGMRGKFSKQEEQAPVDSIVFEQNSEKNIEVDDRVNNLTLEIVYLKPIMLAADIEEYLRLPFSSGSEWNSEELVRTIYEDLLSGDIDEIEKLKGNIRFALSYPPYDMDLPEIHERVNNLLERIDRVRISMMETVYFEPIILATRIEEYLRLPFEYFANMPGQHKREEVVQTIYKQLLSDDIDEIESLQRDITSVLFRLSDDIDVPIEAHEWVSELLESIETLQTKLDMVSNLTRGSVFLKPRMLSYPLFNIGDDGCTYAKASIDKEMFQTLFGKEQLNYYDTHDVYIRNHNGQLSKFLMDKLTKDIVCDSPIVGGSQVSLAACAGAIEFMDIYATADMTSVVSEGEPIDSVKVGYSLKEGLSDYFKKTNQNLIMNVIKLPLYEEEYFRVLDKDRRMDIPSIQKTISNLHEEHDVRGVLAGIAELPGIQVNDPYNILGRNIYMSQDEIRNQYIRNGYNPSASMVKNIEQLNRIVGFNCSLEDMKELGQGKIPEGSCLNKITEKAKELVSEIKDEMDTMQKIEVKEPVLQHDTFVGSDIAP